MTALKLVSVTDGGITTISKGAAELSSALSGGLELSGDCITLKAATAEIAVVGAWMMRAAGNEGEETGAESEDAMTSLEATPALFVAVLVLADFLSLDKLVAQLVAKERRVSLAGRGFTSSLGDACAATVPGWDGLLAGYRGKLVTAAVSQAVSSAAVSAATSADDSNWVETLGEEGQLLYQYIQTAYPKAGDYDNDRSVNSKFAGCTKLLFSAVARGDADTLRAVLEDPRVIALDRPYFYWGNYEPGPVSFEEAGKAWNDTGDVVVEDEGAAGVSLLQYAAEVDAAGCIEVILDVGAEPVDATGVWACRPLHAACWHANLASVKVFVRFERPSSCDEPPSDSIRYPAGLGCAWRVRRSQDARFLWVARVSYLGHGLHAMAPVLPWRDCT